MPSILTNTSNGSQVRHWRKQEEAVESSQQTLPRGAEIGG